MSPASSRRGLGRGLDALLPSAEPAAGAVEVSVSAIARNPRQPRQGFDPARLKELADSIQAHGVLQPLVVARFRYLVPMMPYVFMFAGAAVLPVLDRLVWPRALRVYQSARLALHRAG